MTNRSLSKALAPQPLVLLVDADADTRHMYAEYVRLTSGWSVEEAADGREALALALSHSPAVIVTETRLPGMSGFDLCRLLRADSATRSKPIIVVTGDALEADIRRARLAGADAVLVKPCLPDRLFEEMQRVTDENQPRSEQPAVVPGTESSAPYSAPPAALCPSCDAPLRYVRSHVGGVGARRREQWDYFECSAGCGTFQYRQRTRKLRKI